MSKESKKDEYQERLTAIGNGLRKLRKEKGYSNYHKFAYDLDMIHSQYGAYENGKNLTIATLLKILDFHKITLEEFLREYCEGV